MTPKTHPKVGASGTTVAPPARRRSKRALPAPLEDFRAIRPQHGAWYRVVTDEPRVLKLVRFDAAGQQFVAKQARAGSAGRPRTVPLARVVLLAKRVLARCGGEVFCRLRTWEDDAPAGRAGPPRGAA